MKNIQEWIHVKFFLLLFQIIGLMPLVVGNNGHGNLESSSIGEESSSIPENFRKYLYSSLPLDARQFLDHFRQTSVDLLISKLSRVPLQKHILIHFDDLPEWRVKRRSSNGPVEGGAAGSIFSFKVIEPSSHGVTQTDREYFNIVRTENGVSDFFRFLPRKKDEGGMKKKKGQLKHRPKFIYHRVPGSSVLPFSGENQYQNRTKDVAAVSIAKPRSLV
ncbi:uncharacterized protein [Lepeophtheirus salmonis]|nr:uncharacterized protein LOC121118616 isoform X1 [Lepeophtheirus salmonis]